MKHSVLTVLAVAASIAAASASAQEAPLKPLATGTVFAFVTPSGDPVKITIKKMDGISIQQEQETTQGTVSNENVGFGATLGTASREKMTDSEREAVAGLYPLKVGNSVRSGHSGTANNGTMWTASDKLEVTGAEKVTVPAGTFDTFVIETKMQNDRWWGQNTCWYAPEIGYCAKRKFRSSSSSSDWELTAVTTP